MYTCKRAAPESLALRASPFNALLGSDLEHHSAAGALIAREMAAIDRRTVEISCRVEDQGSAGLISVLPVWKKVVEHGFRPASVRVLRQLEDDSAGVSTAVPSGAIQVPRRVPDDTRTWVTPT